MSTIPNGLHLPHGRVRARATATALGVAAALGASAAAPGCAWMFGGEDDGDRPGRRPGREDGSAADGEPAPAPEREFWRERAEPYLGSPDERRAFEETSPERRFVRFGFQLLDIELRERLLVRYREWLTPEEQEAYRTLRSYRDCRTFIEERVEPGARPGQAGDAPEPRHDEHRPETGP